MWSQDHYYKVYKALISGERALPSLNPYWLALASKINQLAPKGVAFYAPLVLDAVASDPDVSQLLICRANVNRYYGASEVSTVADALLALPASQVVETLYLFAIRNAVIDETLSAHHIVRHLWEDTLQVASICLALSMRLSKSSEDSSKASNNHSGKELENNSLLTGLSHQLGTILLINAYREKGLAMPELADLKDIPEAFTSNVASLAAMKWGLDEAICESALKKGQYQEVSYHPFNGTDLLHMALIHHFNHTQPSSRLVKMKDSLPFIKAVKSKIIQEEANYFTQMISGHSLIIFKGLSPLINKFPISQFSPYGARRSRFG